MRPLTLGPVAIALALAAGAASLTFHDHDRAEASLSAFYSQLAKGDSGAAGKSIGEAARLWPSNARYYAWRGYAAGRELPNQCPAHGAPLDAGTLEQVRSAAADYRRALELNSRDAVAHHNLAWLDHLMGDDREARREWEQAAAIDPGAAIYSLSLGFFLEETGDRGGAARQYVAAIELTPAILDSPFFTRYRDRFPGEAEAAVREAIASIESRLQSGDDPVLKARLGKFCLYRGDLRRASSLLESAAKDLPNLPMVWFNLGEARRLQGDREQAWVCYRKAQFLDNGLPGPFLRMGELYGQAGQARPAVGYLRSAAQKWSHVQSAAAGHNMRLYGGAPRPIDDLLPATLSWYTTPCQASEAYSALARLYPDNRLYTARARTCENLPAPHGGMPK